jgi:hypothetical protein
MTPISLDGRCFNVASTAASGVVGTETIFSFRQDGAFISAEYAGGQIRRGYLVGVLEDAKLTFRYCQIQHDGRLDGGVSECSVNRLPDGRVRIIEGFEWASRPGERGINVFEEIPSAQAR